jgi:hypothetical protein
VVLLPCMLSRCNQYYDRNEKAESGRQQVVRGCKEGHPEIVYPTCVYL